MSTPVQPLGMKGCQLAGWMKLMTAKTKIRIAMSLMPHHHVVGAGRLANAAHQNHGENQHDEEGGNVEAEVPAGMVEPVAGQILQAFGQIGGRDPYGRGMQAEPVQQVHHVGGKAHADGHVGAGVFQNQIPADDPGDQFAQGGVGVGIGRAGDGNHGGQFGVTEAGERADDGHQKQRDGDRRTGAGPAGQRGVGDDVVGQRRVDDAGGVELLAGDGRADDGEDARADHRADAQRGQRPRTESLLERVLGFFRVPDQLVDRLAGAKLPEQGSSPHSAIAGEFTANAEA